jgi:glycosyltransferase involved in cell wall biosynthesis
MINLLERFKYLRQLIKTTFSILLYAGPFELTKRMFLWLRGERRYYRRPATTGSRRRQQLHSGRIEREMRRLQRYLFPKTSISYLIALVGNPSELEDKAYTLIKDLNDWALLHPEHEILLIPDGKIWAHIARGARLPVRVINGTEQATFMPGRLFNLGLRASTKPCIAFGLIGVDTVVWLTNADQLASHFKEDITGVVGQRGETELHQGKIASHRVRWLENGVPDPRYGLIENPSGWLEMLDLVPIHNSLLNREKLLAQGGFIEWLTYGFWWQACLHLARHGKFIEIDLKPPRSQFTIENYPLNCSLFPIDITARIVVTYSCAQDSASLLRDIPELHTYLEVSDGVPDSHPLRVTILGGPFEPHHNQIFFYNYFRLTEGKGILSWRVIDDEYAGPHDIEQADLLIYSRVRSDNGCKLLDYAKFLGIPVLYMLDDNWFTMGQDWQEYSDLIYPGSAFYENALYCIRHADAVVTYNRVIKTYLESQARYIFLQPMGINLSAFPARQVRSEGFVVGYAGSPRQENTAFQALAELARRYPSLKIFYFGWDIPQVLNQIPASQLLLLRGNFSFSDYARQLTELMPDIGLAPLGSSETDRSKNPTKYLDYTAARCAGVYSAVEPYTHYVEHGRTGWLTPGKTVEDWVVAVETLMMDRDLLEQIRAQAYEDVQKKYAVEALLPDFLDMLRRVHQRDY